MTIRKLRVGDEKNIIAFFQSLRPHTRKIFVPHPISACSELVTRALNGTDSTYLAFSGEMCIAYFFLWNVRRDVPLLGIGITDEFQGRGLGKVFMQTLIDEAKALGKHGIELSTALENERAFALYKKMGFRYIEDIIVTDGAGVADKERRMFLPLLPGARVPSENFCSYEQHS